MCGLVGIAGALEYKDEATMKRLLLFDYFRGTDSTGLAAIKGDGTTTIAKIASHPLNLFDMTKFRTALNGNTSRVFLGHNRAPTRGTVNDTNAHPFQFGHIVGAHNGTLTTRSARDLEEALGEKFSVDSMAIFAAIERFGIKETLAMMETGKQPTEGAWSLVWYDLKEKTLNFLRNKHRPLWFSYTKDFKKIIWGSQWPIIHAAVLTETNPYELYTDKEGYRFFPTDEDTLYTFNLDDFKTGAKKHKPRVKKMSGKEPAPVVSTGSWSPFGMTTEELEGVTTLGTPTGKNSGSSTSNNTDTSRSDRKTPLRLEGDYEEPLAGFVSGEKFAGMVKHGCAYCQKKVEYDDFPITIIEQVNGVLCTDCSCTSSSTRIFAPKYLIDAYN